MQFEELNEETLRIAGLTPELAAMLHEAPAIAAGRADGAAAERLFPPPSEDGDLAGDWAEYVEPELRSLFQSTEKTMAGDLKKLRRSSSRKKSEAAGLSVDFPRAHAEAWLNCLNQARLVLATRIGYTDADHDRDFSGPPRSEREIALFHIEFFALIQEWLIQALEGVAEDTE